MVDADFATSAVHRQGQPYVGKDVVENPCLNPKPSAWST
jgi:hypothetical protein